MTYVLFMTYSYSNNIYKISLHGLYATLLFKKMLCFHFSYIFFCSADAVQFLL